MRRESLYINFFLSSLSAPNSSYKYELSLRSTYISIYQIVMDRQVWALAALRQRPLLLNRRRSLPFTPNNLAWNRNWALQGPVNHGDERLRSFLPGFFQAMQQGCMFADAVAQQLALSNGDTEHNGGLPGLSAVDVEQGYIMLYRMIHSTADDSAVADTIQMILEQKLNEDEQRILQSHFDSHERTLQYVRILSAISRQAQSHRLSNIISNFFLANGRTIVEGASIDHLYIWAYTFYKSAMFESEKAACLGVIVNRRPELVEMLLSDGRSRTHRLGRILAEVADNLGLMDIAPRGRGINRRNSPRLISSSRSPFRGGFGPLHRHQGLLGRPSSAPGNRQLEYQADRAIHELERFKAMASSS